MTARGQRLRDDTGTSLMELIMGMALMVIFMGMFTGAVVMMTSATNKVEAVTTTSGQVNQAFLRLDKLVRYASAITVPARSATGDWYVELSIPGTSGSATCTQLRDDLPTQQLQLRTWTVSGDTPAVVSTASAWLPLASSITNTATDVPFVLGTNTKSRYQQLLINLLSASTHPTTATSTASVTFTAVNSTVTPPVACQQWPRP